MPSTQIRSGSAQVNTRAEKLANFLARLLPHIDEEYRWTIAAETFLWNHCCHHISAQSLCFSFKRAYEIDIDKQEILRILERINLLSRTYPSDVKKFKDLAFEWHSYWSPENSKFKDVYKLWSRLQDQMEVEKSKNSAGNGPHGSRYTTSGRTEYSDSYRDSPPRQRARRESVYYRDESRRSPEYSPQRVQTRPSYDIITREPSRTSRGTSTQYAIYTRRERTPRARSTIYTDDYEDSRPRVVVVEPKRRR